MVLNLIVFAWIIFWYSHSRDTFDKPIKFFLLVLCILPTVLMLYGRELSGWGKDFNLYTEGAFYECVNNSNPIMLWQTSGLELGYCVFNWIITRFTDNIRVFTGLHQLLFIGCVIFAANSVKDKHSSIIYLFYFLFIYFSFSCTAYRQVMAVSTIIVGFVFYQERKWIPAFLCLLLAQSFHNSSIIVCIVPLLFYFIDRYEEKVYWLYFGVLAFIGVFYFFFTTSIGDIIVSISDKYEGYLNQDEEVKGIHYTDLVLYIYMYASTYFSDTLEKKRIHIVRLLLLLMLGFVFLGSLFETGNRVATNFAGIMLLCYLSLFDESYYKKIIFCILQLLVVSIFIYGVNRSGLNNTVPYISSFWGIE